MIIPSRARAALFVVPAAVALSLTGCSGSDTPKNDTTTTSAASSPSGAPSSAAPSSVPSSAPATSAAGEPTSAAASPSAAPSPSGTVVTVSVKGKSVTPAPGTVKIKAGEEVTLVVTSDTKNELHLHGIDKEVPLPAGQTVTVKATYPDPGTYEVETHEPSLLLLRFEVR